MRKIVLQTEDMERLVKECGVDTEKDLLNNALSFFVWAIKEIKKGRIIASIDEEEKKYRECQMPVFSNIQKS